MTGLEDMRQELAVIPEALEGAALVEDADLFVRLQMRDLALRSMIRELELEPHRRAVARLEREVEGVEAERVEALSAEPPPVPDALRHTLTPEMLKRRLVEGALRRSSGASRELAEARRKLEDAEGVSGRNSAMTLQT